MIHAHDFNAVANLMIKDEVVARNGISQPLRQIRASWSKLGEDRNASEYILDAV